MIWVSTHLHFHLPPWRLASRPSHRPLQLARLLLQRSRVLALNTVSQSQVRGLRRMRTLNRRVCRYVITARRFVLYGGRGLGGVGRTRRLIDSVGYIRGNRNSSLLSHCVELAYDITVLSTRFETLGSANSTAEALSGTAKGQVRWRKDKVDGARWRCVVCSVGGEKRGCLGSTSSLSLNKRGRAAGCHVHLTLQSWVLDFRFRCGPEQLEAGCRARCNFDVNFCSVAAGNGVVKVVQVGKGGRSQLPLMLVAWRTGSAVRHRRLFPAP